MDDVTTCDTCLIRMFYARAHDMHFDWRDCWCECGYAKEMRAQQVKGSEDELKEAIAALEKERKMITIEDYDLPIVVAKKIICGTRPYNSSPLVKEIAKAFTGDESAGETQDMFSLEEIKEIAEYLMVYVKSHQNGD